MYAFFELLIFVHAFIAVINALIIIYLKNTSIDFLKGL